MITNSCKSGVSSFDCTKQKKKRERITIKNQIKRKDRYTQISKRSINRNNLINGKYTWTRFY